MNAKAVAVHEILRAHRRARGMVVAMGTTCECGYWTGTEKPGVNRPIGIQGDGLDWHRSELIAALLEGERVQQCQQDMLAKCIEAVEDRRVPWPMPAGVLVNEGIDEALDALRALQVTP